MNYDFFLRGADEVPYAEVVAYIDAQPESDLFRLVRWMAQGAMRYPLLTELISHGDYERLSKIWTSPSPRTNGIHYASMLVENYVRATTIALTLPADRLVAIDFLLANVVNNIDIGSYISNDILGSVDAWLESWLDDIPLVAAAKRQKSWAQSQPYARIRDLIAADQHSVETMKNKPHLRYALDQHVVLNQRMPDILEFFQGAVRTTRTHFFYRGMDIKERKFDGRVLAPISTTWSLDLARRFASNGLLMVIRVPPGVPIFALPRRSMMSDVADADEKEILLPSFALLSELSSESAMADFVEQWYDYRNKSDVYHERAFSGKLLFVDYTFVRLGLAKRLRERASEIDYLPNYDPTDTMTDAMRRL